jgi:hypothetical protein
MDRMSCNKRYACYTNKTILGTRLRVRGNKPNTMTRAAHVMAWAVFGYCLAT